MSRYDGIIRISKTRNVKTPTRGTPESSGLDFYVPSDLTSADMEAMFDKPLFTADGGGMGKACGRREHAYAR